MAIIRVRDIEVDCVVDFTPPITDAIDCLGIVESGTAEGFAPDNDVRSCAGVDDV